MITIQRTPAAGGASTTKTLAEWGFASGDMQSAAWAVSYLTLTARGGSPAFDAPVFEYLDVIKVFDGTTCIWWGPVVANGLTVQPAEQRTYSIANPAWWLQCVPFAWPISPEPVEIDTTAGDVWMAYALWGNGAVETGSVVGVGIPCPDLRGSANVWEVIQRVARLCPMSTQWWDLSGPLPAFHAAHRDDAAPITIARSICEEPITLTPRHDKRLAKVRIDYQFTNGSGTISSAADISGTGPETGPNSLRFAVAVGTESAIDASANAGAARVAQNVGLAELIRSAYAVTPWEGSLTVVGTPSRAIPDVRPGQAVNLSGGRAEWGTMAALVQSVSRSLGETCERLQIELGCGDHLSPPDFINLARGGGASGGAAGGNPSPYIPPRPPPTPPPPGGTPGTLGDLNGGGAFPGGTLDGTIAVEKMAVTGDLKGFAENTGYTSTPPRFYLDMALGSTWTDHVTGFSFGWVPAD